MTWTWKNKWQLGDSSRTMRSAFVVEQQSSINNQILCPKDFSLYNTGKHPLSFSPPFLSHYLLKMDLIRDFSLPISDFAHHLHWQGLNLKFMGVIRNEWIIIVQINPVWSGGIVRYCGCRCLDSFSKYCSHPYFQIVHIDDKIMIW